MPFSPPPPPRPLSQIPVFDDIYVASGYADRAATDPSYNFSECSRAKMFREYAPLAESPADAMALIGYNAGCVVIPRLRLWAVVVLPPLSLTSPFRTGGDCACACSSLGEHSVGG
jgi:hypothetical protein